MDGIEIFIKGIYCLEKKMLQIFMNEDKNDIPKIVP